MPKTYGELEMKGSPTSDLTRLLLFAADRAIYEHVSVELGFCSKADCSSIQSPFLVEVTDISESRVVFCFPNAQPGTYSISDICFHDDGLLGAATIMGCADDSDIEFPHDDFMTSTNTNHGNTENRGMTHSISGAMSADVGPIRYTNVYGPQDSWVVIFDLLSGTDFADIMYALNKGRLRITIKVKELESGRYELLTNEPNLMLGHNRRTEQSGSFPLRRTA
jgi:hypothetical protein